MEKKTKNILIWVLTWAGLLLVVLYSPLGSPDLFNQNGYYFPNHGNIYSEGESTINFPTPRKNSENNVGYQVINIPDNTTSQSKMYSYSVSGYGKSIGSSATYTASVSNFSNNINRSSGGGNMGSGGGEGFYSKGNNSKNKTNITQETGLLSLSTDLSLLGNNTSNRQLAGAGLNSGVADPGGDPTGDPIPVGDGWIFLLVVATGYAMRRIKVFSNKQRSVD